MIKHLEVKRAYYNDPENLVVEECTDGVTWIALSTEPVWSKECKYRIKTRTIRIGEIDVPEPVREPVREALEIGQEYFIADICAFYIVAVYKWTGLERDDQWLSRGLIHLTREAAELHAKALILVSGGSVE